MAQETYKLLLAYDGTNYGGWQIQKNSATIQQHLQEALTTVLRVPTLATGAGRTDAGVHAQGQCAHFSSLKLLDEKYLLCRLNGLLPKDIRIISVEHVHVGFHARYSVKSKIYRYYLTLLPFASPFSRLYSWHLPMPFDLEGATAAAAAFLGSHDFRSFTNVGSVCRSGTVRNLDRLDVVPTNEGLYFEFQAPGFLYKMVRNIVGTLVDVALGRCSLKEIQELFSACDRRAAGSTAPPHGLFLWKVEY